METSLINRLVAGDYTDAEINTLVDDAVDEWHESDTPESLATHLGLRGSDYRAWVKSPDHIVKLVRFLQTGKQ